MSSHPQRLECGAEVIISQVIGYLGETICLPFQLSRSQALKFGLDHQEQKLGESINVVGFLQWVGGKMKWRHHPAQGGGSTEMNPYSHCGGLVREQNLDPHWRVCSRTKLDGGRFWEGHPGFNKGKSKLEIGVGALVSMLDCKVTA